MFWSFSRGPFQVINWMARWQFQEQMIKVLRSPAVIISLSLRFSVTFCEPITCRVLVESISIFTDEISIYIDIIFLSESDSGPKNAYFLSRAALTFNGSGLQNQNLKISILKDHNFLLFDVIEQF